MAKPKTRRARPGARAGRIAEAAERELQRETREVFLGLATAALERLLAPPDPPRRPVDERRFDVVRRTCMGTVSLCGERMVPESWTYCPYCAHRLEATA